MDFIQKYMTIALKILQMKENPLIIIIFLNFQNLFIYIKII